MRIVIVHIKTSANFLLSQNNLRVGGWNETQKNNMHKNQKSKRMKIRIWGCDKDEKSALFLLIHLLWKLQKSFFFSLSSLFI